VGTYNWYFKSGLINL